MRRCGCSTSAVRRYGATTLTGHTSGPPSTPALWITASMRPRRLTSRATLRVWSRSARSPTATSAPRSTRSPTASSRPSLRTWRTTSCPSSTSACAASRPRPSAEPVMKTRAIAPARTSAVDHPLVRLGVASALRLDLRVVDLTQVVGRQLDVDCCVVLLEAVQLRRAGDRNEPRLLREDPCEGDLRSRCALSLRNLLEQLDEGAVRSQRLRVEARNGASEIRRLEGLVDVDLPGEESLAEWAERNESDLELVERRDDLLLRLAPPH